MHLLGERSGKWYALQLLPPLSTIMSEHPSKPNPISLAREILKFRKEKHPFGYNYAVRVRLGHAEIQDLTAIADIVFALEELGYEVKKAGRS